MPSSAGEKAESTRAILRKIPMTKGPETQNTHKRGSTEREGERENRDARDANGEMSVGDGNK
jgi:hypothetical protein